MIGWRTIQVDEEDSLNLYFAFFNEDGVVDTPELSPRLVWSAPNNWANIPERARIKIVLEAICRFINAGGNMEEAFDLVSTLKHFSGEMEVETPDHELVAVFDTTTHSIIYRSIESGEYIRMVPDDFTETLGDEDMYNLAKDCGLIDGDLESTAAVCGPSHLK